MATSIKSNMRLVFMALLAFILLEVQLLGCTKSDSTSHECYPAHLSGEISTYRYVKVHDSTINKMTGQSFIGYLYDSSCESIASVMSDDISMLFLIDNFGVFNIFEINFKKNNFRQITDLKTLLIDKFGFSGKFSNYYRFSADSLDYDLQFMCWSTIDGYQHADEPAIIEFNGDAFAAINVQLNETSKGTIIIRFTKDSSGAYTQHSYRVINGQNTEMFRKKDGRLYLTTMVTASYFDWSALPNLLVFFVRNADLKFWKICRKHIYRYELLPSLELTNFQEIDIRKWSDRNRFQD